SNIFQNTKMQKEVMQTSKNEKKKEKKEIKKKTTKERNEEDRKYKKLIKEAICYRMYTNGNSIRGNDELKKKISMYFAGEFKDKLQFHESATVLTRIQTKEEGGKYLHCWLFEDQKAAARWL